MADRFWWPFLEVWWRKLCENVDNLVIIARLSGHIWSSKWWENGRTIGDCYLKFVFKDENIVCNSVLFAEWHCTIGETENQCWKGTVKKTDLLWKNVFWTRIDRKVIYYWGNHLQNEIYFEQTLNILLLGVCKQIHLKSQGSDHKSNIFVSIFGIYSWEMQVHGFSLLHSFINAKTLFQHIFAAFPNRRRRIDSKSVIIT